MTSDMLSTLSNGYTIYTWYDRQSRNWITQYRDAEGNQIGNALFSGNTKDANTTHKEMATIAQIIA